MIYWIILPALRQIKGQVVVWWDSIGEIDTVCVCACVCARVCVCVCVLFAGVGPAVHFTVASRQ